jgi:hypothetical protein
MRRLCASFALLALLTSAGAAHAVSVGVGAFGGLSVPIVQDDTGQGTVFGLRVPVNLVPMISVEPYFSSASGGDKEETFGSITETRTGLDVTGFGANVLIPFGTGFRFYPFAGIGSHTIKREGSDDLTKTAYNFGLGIGFSPPVVGLSVDVRGELTAVVDGDVSRKWANATVGVSYNVFKMAP